ncbi:Exc2 family lipoprotein [Pantoea sp.]|uniref:Exc2 family lipoprotein n=1 Tax=Pantoea sp. TaxID=69393 RepID=UPI0028AE6049|nr:Exc2 family lipoprotein [Pantoea sp.]
MLKNTLAISAIALSLVFLSSCTQSDNSAKRHAIHFVHTVDDNDPNFRMNKADSIRLMTPFFEQFWQQGKKDREAGLTATDIQQRVNYYRSDEFIKSIHGTSQFAGKEYKENVSPHWRENMAKAISETYMDGFEGRE